MRKISCLGGDYLLERGLLSRAGEIIGLNLKPEKVMIISDENVFSLYGPQLIESFENFGIKADSMVFSPGEETKSLKNAERILLKLSRDNYSRSDVLTALGGGVIGDLGGFAASCFKRGMKLVQIPTSLLAMVDSSVGGKTGVNLGEAKNQVGTFYQPSLSLADPDCLESLPEREYRCGCAEVIKYACLFDREFFDSLCKLPVKDQYEDVIEKCVCFKRDIVIKDEQDSGLRQLLNFGHTIGHGVEALSRYEIQHGEAVAIGMAEAAALSFKKGFCAEDVPKSITAILNKYGLPVKSAYSGKELFEMISKDKKISGDKISFIIPEEIGKCSIVKMDKNKTYLFLNPGDAI